MVLSYSSGKIIAKLEKSSRILVNDVSFSLDAGKSLALIGETGSGKTMIALSVMGLLPKNVYTESSGIFFLGNELTTKNIRPLLGNQIVYIPQNGLEFLNPSRKIRQHLYDNLKRVGVSRSNLEKVAIQNRNRIPSYPIF